MLLHGAQSNKYNYIDIICGMWSLWTMRNKRRHGEPHLPARQGVEWVCDTAFDLWNVLHPEKDQRAKLNQCWNKPQHG